VRCGFPCIRLPWHRSEGTISASLRFVEFAACRQRRTVPRASPRRLVPGDHCSNPLAAPDHDGICQPGLRLEARRAGLIKRPKARTGGGPRRQPCWERTQAVTLPVTSTDARSVTDAPPVKAPTSWPCSWSSSRSDSPSSPTRSQTSPAGTWGTHLGRTGQTRSPGLPRSPGSLEWPRCLVCLGCIRGCIGANCKKWPDRRAG
jgi:hypothetical protein